MKIQYQFATETIEIEVSDDWGNLVIELDRVEYNNDHKETRRHVSLNALSFDGESVATEDPGLAYFTEKDELYEAIRKLTPNQQYIIRAHYFDGRTFTDIANELGVGVSSVTRAVERAKNSLKKFL